MKTIFLSCIAFVFWALPASAATGPWQGGAEFQARLIAAKKSHDASPVFYAGLEVKLSEGWKIYWRSPGEAGLPPELIFQNPQ